MSAAGFSRGAPKRLLDAIETAIPTGAVMPRDQAQALVEKVVKMSKADAVTVSVSRSASFRMTGACRWGSRCDRDAGRLLTRLLAPKPTCPDEAGDNAAVSR